MGYDKHTWMNGEIITAEKMNCMEDGLDCVSNCSCLWVNGNPTEAFQKQKIYINTADYATFDLCFITQDEDTWQNITISINKSRCYAVNGEYNTFVKFGNYIRYLTIMTDGIQFDDCTYGIKYNGKLIPYSVHAFR